MNTFHGTKNEKNWSFKPTTTVPLLGRQPLKSSKDHSNFTRTKLYSVPVKWSGKHKLWVRPKQPQSYCWYKRSNQEERTSSTFKTKKDDMKRKLKRNAQSVSPAINPGICVIAFRYIHSRTIYDLIVGKSVQHMICILQPTRYNFAFDSSSSGQYFKNSSHSE